MDPHQLLSILHTFLQNYPLEHNFHIQSFVQTLRYNNAANQLYSDEKYKLHAKWLLDALLAERLCHPAQLDILLKSIIEMENDDNNRYSFRLTAATFLSEQLQPHCALLAWALSFLRNDCCSFLHNAPAFGMRNTIFARCLKLWHTEGLSDHIVHHMLLSLLQDLRVPSSVWISELQSSSRMHYQSCIAECDRLLEEQLQCPSLAALKAQAFAEAIPPDVVANSMSIQIRIALCSALRPIETGPLLKHLTDLKLIVPNDNFQVYITNTHTRGTHPCTYVHHIGGLLSRVKHSMGSLSAAALA
ncbi:hypothetical protein BX666DRAFT_1893143 [Dichotomocladium elegans]|nr:hypothetical protein BX666DRAFT_1893143 [Dichotomocladium elegans]